MNAFRSSRFFNICICPSPGHGWGMRRLQRMNGSALSKPPTLRRNYSRWQITPRRIMPTMSPTGLTPRRSNSRLKIAEPTPDASAWRWQLGIRLRRKLWRRRLSGYGPMTIPREITMLTCDCCSASRMARLNQRSGRLRFLSLRSR